MDTICFGRDGDEDFSVVKCLVNRKRTNITTKVTQVGNCGGKWKDWTGFVWVEYDLRKII